MKIKKAKYLSVIFTIALSVAILFAFSCTASAAEISQTQDGLTAVIDTDSESYEANSNIEIAFKVTNTNGYSVKNVSLEALIPDSLTLSDTSAETVKSVSELDPGESVELNLTAVKKSAEQTETNNTDTTAPAPNDNSGSANSTNAPGTVENAADTTSAAETSNAGNSTVATGANATGILACIVCLAGALAVIYFLKNKKSAKRCISIVLSVCIGAGAVTAIALPVEATSENYSFTVEKSLIAGSEECLIKTRVTYEKTAQATDDQSVTRGEWVEMLFTELSMSEISGEDITVPYSDISDSEYYTPIVTAYYYSVLPTDIDEFKPEENASRDFAAYTLNNCLGYVKNSDLSCDDFDSIKYQDAASALTERGYFELENNRFMPEKAVTKAEADKIKSLIAESLASLEIDENHENEIDVNDDAVVFYDDVIKSSDGSTVVLNADEETSALKEGDVFFAPDPENSALTAAYKIKSLSVSGNEIILETSEPDITEMYNKVNIQGVARGNTGSALRAYSNDNLSSAAGDSFWDKLTELNEKANDFFNPKKHYDNTYALNAENFRFDGTYTIGNKDGNRIEVVLHGGLENPEIAYNINFEINPFNKIKPIKDNYNFYISLKDKLVFNGTATLISKDCEQGEYTLATVPVELCPGVSVNVSIVLVVSAEGKITVKYELENTVGVKIDKKNGVQLIREFSDSQPEVTAHVEAKVGIMPKVALSLAGFGEIISVNAEIGAKGSATLRIFSHSDDAHTDLSLYMYFNIGYGTDSFVKELLNLAKQETSGTKEIINEANSPLKIKMHVENLTEVKNCTYRYVSGTVEEKGYPLDNVKISVYDGKQEITLGENESNLTSGAGNFGFLIPCKADKTNYSDKLTFVFSKDGYNDLTKTYTVKTAEDTNLGTIEMTESAGTGGEQENVRVINSDDELTLTGTLSSEYYENSSTSKGTVAILNLDTPFKCYVYDEWMSNNGWDTYDGKTEFYIDSVQVSLTNAQEYYGKKISVTGSVMLAHTAHHQRTIVLENCSVSYSENYKEAFINALLENEDEWYQNWGASVGYQSQITFTDLNFDGRPELIMQYGGGSMRNNNAAAFYYDDNKICQANNGFQNNLVGYYDKSTEKYVILGDALCRDGEYYIWFGNFELTFDGTSVNSDYYSSYIADDGNYTYYNGANGYSDTTGINPISETEYNKIKQDKLENLVDINMNCMHIPCSDWENYTAAEKKQALETVYDGFTYDKY